MNRWTAEHEAQRLLAQLESLPIGDGNSYHANQESRLRLTMEYPELESRFEVPAKAWEYASVEEWTNQLNVLEPGDLAGLEKLRNRYATFTDPNLDEAELAWFGRTYDEMKPGDLVAAKATRAVARPDLAWARPIRAWEEAWTVRTITQAVAEAESNTEKNPVDASLRLHELAKALSELGIQEKAMTRLRTERRQTLRASMATAQRDALALLRQGKYQAAADVCLRLKSQLAPEAKLLDMDAEMLQIVDSYGFLADLARQAGKSDSN
jgi:hypothetical protein